MFWTALRSGFEDRLGTLPELRLPLESSSRVVIALRELLAVALACLILSRAFPETIRFQEWLLLGFFASTVILRGLGPGPFAWRAFDVVLVALDTAVVSLLIFYTGSIHLTVLFFLVILLAALGERLSGQLAAATVLAGFDAWFTFKSAGALTPFLLLRVPFFYAVALYYGFFVCRVRAEREEAERVRTERRELKTLVKILEDVTSSLDPRQVMRKVVAHVNDVLPSQRVSILLLDESKEWGTVLASSDDPDLDPVVVDLEKYPEIRETIRRREPVMIEDAGRSELLTPVKEQILHLGFNSLVLVPMMFADEAIGTLILRAASRNARIDPEQYRFCRMVAAASANALKNAMLHRRISWQVEAATEPSDVPRASAV